MKKIALAACAAIALTAGSAFAADIPVKAARVAVPPPPPAWDIAFGAAVQSDYIFRGISQSNRGASANGYFELQWNNPIGQIYWGIAGYAISWPTGIGFTDPSAEIDFTVGWRKTWDKFSLDLGFIYYYYPAETFNGATSDSDFWEFYAKLGYAITPDLSVGAAVYYTPDILHYRTTFRAAGVSAEAEGVYAAFNAKWVTPWKRGDWGTFISGEVGHWFIDSAGFTAAAVQALIGPTVNPSYTHWNVGLGITYKVFTLDLRYHGTDMDNTKCGSFLLVGRPHPSNSWCSDAFVAKLKVDTALSALK
jgi:uncharacterized protein (TIGR02001 family)